MLNDQGRTRLEAGYREFGGDVWNAILAFADGRRDVADEAVAEAFAQAGRRLDAIRSLRPWVFRTAFRIAAAELGRLGAHRELQEREMTPSEAAVDRLVIDAEVARLTHRQRRVFVLRDVLGYTTKETVELLGGSEVGVRVHLHAARRRLRGSLVMEGDA